MHAHSNRSVRGIGVDPFFSGVERGKWTISVDNNNGSRAMRIIVHHAIIIYTCRVARSYKSIAMHKAIYSHLALGSIHHQHTIKINLHSHSVGAGDKSTLGSNPTTKQAK